MQSHFETDAGWLSATGWKASGGGLLPGGQIKSAELVKAEAALAGLRDIMRKMVLVGADIPGEMLALEPIREDIVRIWRTRALPGMTPNCKAWGGEDLRRAMNNQIILEGKLGWHPKHPLPRRT